jgi:hypothetical protein
MVAVTGLLLGAPSSHSQDSEYSNPSMPILAWGVCPREYCSYGNWIARRATLVRSDRQRDAPVAFRLYRGDRVFALTGVVVTTEPGIAEFSKDAVLTNYDPSETPQRVRFKKGDRLFILRFELEGQIAGWSSGKAFDYLDGLFDCRPFDNSHCVAELIKRPVSEWWAQVQRNDGSKGWTRDMDAFDGIDRH